jgi:hypothetical protein
MGGSNKGIHRFLLHRSYTNAPEASLVRTAKKIVSLSMLTSLNLRVAGQKGKPEVMVHTIRMRDGQIYSPKP